MTQHDKYEELTNSQNFWIKKILKSKFDVFYPKEFLHNYNPGRRFGNAKINDRFLETMIDKTR